MKTPKKEESLPFEASATNPNATSRNILIVGASGSGKSRAIKNLNPESTLIINAESKPLPFKDAQKFKKQLTLIEEKPLELFNILKYFAKKEKIKTIVIDSFSEWSDHLILFTKKTEKNFDIYGKYNEYVEKLFRRIKKLTERETPLNIIVITHDEILQDAEGNMIRRAKVRGKELKSQIERHFALVLYSTVQFKKDDKREYRFQVNADEVIAAKSPEGMFDNDYIENDYQLVIESMEKYWG